jgi:GT2 family glycosyltransferase
MLRILIEREAFMLSFITVNYNSSDLIKKKLFTSLQNNLTSEWELIIVDNNSNENEKNKLNFFNNYKNVKIILENMNHGFGKACNIGVESARGEIIIFINPDVRLIEKGLEKFIENYLKEDIGILAPRLLNEDLSIQPNGGGFTGLSFYLFYSLRNIISKDKLKKLLQLRLFNRTPYADYLKNFQDQESKSISYDWVSGAFMIMRKEVFKKIKGFDRNFFMYTEDKDLCYQVKKRLRLNIVINNSYKTIHSVGGTQDEKVNPDMELIKLKSRIYYIYKNEGISKAILLKYFYTIIVFIQVVIGKHFDRKHLTEILKYDYTNDSATIIGYYGSGNIGDECILHALLQEYDYTKNVVLSNNVELTKQLHLVDAYPKKNILGILKALMNTKRLIIGGGGLFLRDNTATYVYFYFLSLLFRLFRKEIFVDGIGLNHEALKKKSHKLLFGGLIKNAAYVKVRDQYSYDLINEAYKNKFQNKVSVRNDFVFDFLNKWKAGKNLKEKKKIVGVSIMNLQNTGENLKNLILQYVKRGYRIKFYIFFENEGDLVATNTLIKKIGIKNFEIIKIKLEQPEDFNNLFEDLSKNEIFISMRFHPMLISFVLGARVYVFPHNSKISNFATKYNLETIV